GAAARGAAVARRAADRDAARAAAVRDLPPRLTQQGGDEARALYVYVDWTARFGTSTLGWSSVLSPEPDSPYEAGRASTRNAAASASSCCVRGSSTVWI